MKTIEKVHIIPLGFERSVAVKPLRVLGGNRAHIITIGGKYAARYDLWKEQRYFEEAVVRDLKEMDVEVKVHYADLFDFREAVRVIAGVVVSEKEQGKEVYLNLSSHGRLVSIASALVGWYHDVRMYYVLASRYARNEEEKELYGRSVCDKPLIFEVPQVEIVRLTEEERFTLSIIYGDKPVELRRIVEEFCRRFPHIYQCEKDERGRWKRSSEQKVKTKLNRRVLLKLESKGFIERDKVGRNVYLRITDRGEIFALLGGSDAE
jgi:hypothetical protein